MPFKSDAQRRWAHTEEGEMALGGPAGVKEWNVASKGLKLPKRKIPRAVSPPPKPKYPRAAGKSTIRKNSPTAALLGLSGSMAHPVLGVSR